MNWIELNFLIQNLPRMYHLRVRSLPGLLAWYSAVMRFPDKINSSSTGHQQVISRSSAGHQQGISRSLAGHQQVISRSSAGHQQVISRSSAGHQQGISRSSAGHQQVISRSSAGHQQVISRSLAGHQQVISRSSSGHQQFLAVINITSYKATSILFSYPVHWWNWCALIACVECEIFNSTTTCIQRYSIRIQIQINFIGDDDGLMLPCFFIRIICLYKILYHIERHINNEQIVLPLLRFCIQYVIWKRKKSIQYLVKKKTSLDIVNKANNLLTMCSVRWQQFFSI